MRTPPPVAVRGRHDSLLTSRHSLAVGMAEPRPEPGRAAGLTIFS